MPSEAEVERIWNPVDRDGWLREQAAAHGCHMVVKRGEQGSIVCDAAAGRLIDVPAFPAAVVDTTGAGDGYCGGFLAGLVEGRPLAECAAMGTVSASYVVEACGALETRRPSPADRDGRLRAVLQGLSTLGVTDQRRPVKRSVSRTAISNAPTIPTCQTLFTLS